jgi:ABC-type phosphate transport system permease subunit
MIRFLFRFIGLWLLAGAFVALVIDGTRSVSASQMLFSPLGDAWALIAPANLASVQKVLAGGVYETLLKLLLAVPFFAALAALGLLFLLIGRRKSENRIGYSSRD